MVGRVKTLLINPPAAEMPDPFTMERRRPAKSWVPLGVAYLGAALRAAGHDVTVRDMHSFSWAEVESELRAIGPDVVGVSCFTMWRSGALEVARMAKELNPDVTVILGGPHSTFFPAHIFEPAPVDAVVLGEGEQTLVELVGVLERGEDPVGVKGLVLRRDGVVVETGSRPRLAELDTLPFPLYDHVDLAEYKSPEIPPPFQPLAGTHIITSRGCPFSCRFCSVPSFWGRRWRARSPGNVADELEWLYKDYNVRHVYFSDDLFSFDRERVAAICREILRRKLDIVWMAETRVDCVDREMLRWMRRAGCYRIYYGVESGSARILRNINKGVTPDQIKYAFKITHEAGIQPCAFLMVGNPGEDESTIDETIALVREIRPATTPIIGLTQLMPATHLYEQGKAAGLVSDDFWRGNRHAPFYTAEHSVEELVELQFRLTRGVAPELYRMLEAMGLGSGYLHLRRLLGRAGRVQ
ncbi:MAG: Radical SAM domain protein [Clostridia bacterium 62_21]|nr:MAG: Radical SAM domain protein [Clostridia bacterium 62_21]